MNWLGAALRELFSLFVDDVWFIGEPCPRINAVQLGGFDQRIGDCGGFGRAF